MKPAKSELWGSIIVALAGLTAIGFVGFGPARFPWGSILTAVSGVLASAGLLVWLTLDERTRIGRLPAWGWGIGASLVMGLGSAADYFLWFADSRLWTVGCHVVALVLVGAASWKTGWSGGLRAALVAHLVATPILLGIFWWNLGVPVQAAVFQANGMLDGYAASKVTAFVQWISDAFLDAVLPRTLAAMTAGFLVGAGLSWVRKGFGRR